MLGVLIGCGASESQGDEFEMIWATRVLYTGSARTVGGVLKCPDNWSEIGFDRNTHPTLRCDECGHAWKTSRPIAQGDA